MQNMAFYYRCLKKALIPKLQRKSLFHEQYYDSLSFKQISPLRPVHFRVQ